MKFRADLTKRNRAEQRLKLALLILMGALAM
jgi:hypothetical protein